MDLGSWPKSALATNKAALLKATLCCPNCGLGAVFRDKHYGMNDISLILKAELSELTSKNPNFSMRAFARKLDVSPSHLSRILSGQKFPSRSTTERLLRELNVNPKIASSVLEKAKEKKKTPLASGRKKYVDARNKRILELEAFRVVADWYHFPILELIRTKNFVSTPKFISKRLGISIQITESALDRLEKLDLITRSKNEIRLTNSEFMNTSNDIQSLAIRKHHEQMLAKATEALLEQEPEKREFQALNLNFNPEDTTAAKTFIRKFFKDFNKRFSAEIGSEVFQLNLQLFSLTKDVK